MPTGFVFFTAGGADVLPGLDEPYDLIFSDGDPEEMRLDLEHFLRLLRPGGLLVSANLFLAQFVPDLPGIAQMAESRQRLLDDGRLLTAIVPGGLALSIVRPDPGEIK
jgi:predicted O-methyltransferase YrrM